MDIWSSLNVDQRLTVMVAVGSLILGGAISIVSSFIARSQSNRFALKQKAIDRSEIRASLAQGAFVKILQYANYMHSMKGTIDDQFDEADAEGHGALLPVQKIQEIGSLRANFERFRTEEITFLLRGSDAELLGDLLIFERRAESMESAVSLYNERRAELTARLEAGSVSANTDGAAVLTSVLEGREAILADVRIGALQRLLGTIMERLDRDVVFGRRLLARFQEAARKEFGDLFPNLQFLEPENNV
ncbi:hypothetical protein [Salipiger sp.]|uniref:hypothetical protein n=1 Tax=Salipiger sp. TaxID=2078585 RepID=UPI003A9733EA